MDFDPVETRRHRILRRLHIARDERRKLGGFQRARRHVFLHALVCHDLPHRTQRRRGHRRGTTGLQVGVRDAPDVPELDGDPAARRMHRSSHLFPAGDLLLRMDARRARIAMSLRTDRRRFGQDQTGRSALAVVLDRQIGRHVAGAGAIARQRGHDNAVGQVDGAEVQRGE